MFHQPSSLKTIKHDKTSGQFEIDNLYPGYGITVGNALRRILLSSIEGSAVTSFQIKGVNQEFSTIPFVLENTLDIMLNLKQLKVKIYGNEPQVLKMIKKGEGVIKAKDFQPNSAVEIMNPDLVIVTITDKKGSLDMEATIEKGLGYVQVEERKKEKLPIGTIAVDAIFTPVEKVNLEVENMRVGDRTDFNKLIVSIKTDGSISPKEAIAQAASILEDHFHFIKLEASSISKEKLEMPSEEKGKKTRKEPKEISVQNLELSKRTKNALEANNIKSLAGLLRYRKENLAKLDGLGEKSLKEIQEVLKILKYTLE